MFLGNNECKKKKKKEASFLTLLSFFIVVQSFLFWTGPSSTKTAQRSMRHTKGRCTVYEKLCAAYRTEAFFKAIFTVEVLTNGFRILHCRSRRRLSTSPPCVTPKTQFIYHFLAQNPLLLN